jgi:hypothetical protein
MGVSRGGAAAHLEAMGALNGQHIHIYSEYVE